MFLPVPRSSAIINNNKSAKPYIQKKQDKPYAVLAINPGHNGSAALVIDGKLVYYGEEERYTHLKHDGNPVRAMLNAIQISPIDEFVIGGTQSELPTLSWTGEDPYSSIVRKFNKNVKTTIMTSKHHLGHASSAFYGSGFKSAVTVVIDGSGSHKEWYNEQGRGIGGGFETESIYKCSYPCEFVALHKRYSDGVNKRYVNGIHECDPSITIVKAYEAVTIYLGFSGIEAGKTMGLAPYGEQDENIPEFFINDKGNKNLLIPYYPLAAKIDDARYPYLHLKNDNIEVRDWHHDFSLCRQVDKNLAWSVQKETEEQVIKLIQKAIDLSGETNVVLSGGYGLNCVANYKIIKHFPHIKFYVDPVSHDGGTSIGLARYVWHNHSQDKTIRPLKSLYLSMQPKYSTLDAVIKELDGLVSISDTTPEEIVDLIDQGNIVTLFQGRSEAGPRALGNRSILFDPRKIDGKDIVNSVKRREWFRPFAGSVMEEHAKDWFEMETLESSPFMMYAVDVKKDKVDLIPAVTHVDNTCRVQTVSMEDNPNYYTLINAFYKKTGIPILFNTSLNLAGDPLVETIADAVGILLNSHIQYLYLPELNKLVKKLKGDV
jgi:carbamoyltransferase